MSLDLIHQTFAMDGSVTKVAHVSQERAFKTIVLAAVNWGLIVME